MVRRLSVLGTFVILTILVPSIAAQEASVLRIAAVFDLSEDSRFGPTAFAGLNAAIQDDEMRARFASMGYEVELLRIDTRGDFNLEDPRNSGGKALRSFLEQGGRIVFGADTTGETNKLLRQLKIWVGEKTPEEVIELRNNPVLVFSPVSSSILLDGEKQWSNEDQDAVFLFRVAVSDEQALRILFSQEMALRYDLLPNLGIDGPFSPGAKEVRRNMTIFVEKRENPSDDGRPVDIFENVRKDEIDGNLLRGSPMPAISYATGFVQNLVEAMRTGDDSRLLAHEIVFWNPAKTNEEDRQQVTDLVREIVGGNDSRAVLMVGYADFVKAVNEIFVEILAEENLASRALPSSLFRFTGGTVKLQHLRQVSGDDGKALDGIHFLRTLPSDGDLTVDERVILEKIYPHLNGNGQVNGNPSAEQLEDHTLQAYLGMEILCNSLENVKENKISAGDSRDLQYRRLERILRGYDRTVGADASKVLDIPFFGRTEFTAAGDIRATRHVYFVHSTRNARYQFIQADRRLGSKIHWGLISVLAGGFFLAIVILVNWKKIVGGGVKIGPVEVNNPYEYGVPVKKPEMYFGRRDAFKQFMARIEKGPFALLIAGGRRSGKSSFLHLLSQGGMPGRKDHPEEAINLQDFAIPIYLDLQKLPNFPSDDEVLRDFLRVNIEEAVRSRGIEVSVEGSPGSELMKLSRLFQEVRKATPQSLILLLFDEIELLNDRFADGTLNPSFPQVVRSWIQDSDMRVAVVFTGAPVDTFDEKSREVWAPLSGILQKLTLGPISKPESMALASEPLEGEVVVEKAAQEAVHELCGGQPFLSQAICHMAVNALNSSLITQGITRLPVTLMPEVIEEAVLDFVENTPGHVDDMWSRVLPEERYLLILMAKRLSEPGEAVGLDNLMQFAKSQRFNIVDDGREADMVPVWKRTLERMVAEKTFISRRRDRENNGGEEDYLFFIDLMRRWLQEKEIWPVIDELKTRYEHVGD